jgi:membrane protein DedA with SNARE-associated domain
MVTEGKLSFVGIVIAGTFGSVLGALPLYCIGRMIHEPRLKELVDRYGRWLTISRKHIEKAKRWFDKHGGAAVLLCRLLPTVRSLISIPAGIARMHPGLFLAYTTIGTALWTSLLAYLGYVLGSSVGEVGKYLDLISWLVVATIVLIYVMRVIRQK